MFYEQFEKVCKNKNTTVSAVLVALGMSKGCIRNWKNGVNPKYETKLKIANYLGVSYNDLLSEKEKAEQAKQNAISSATDELDNELQEYLEELKNRSEMRMLFSLAKGATKENVEQAVKIIEALKKDD